MIAPFYLILWLVNGSMSVAIPQRDRDQCEARGIEATSGAHEVAYRYKCEPTGY